MPLSSGVQSALEGHDCAERRSRQIPRVNVDIDAFRGLELFSVEGSVP